MAKRILIVDDEPRYLRLLEANLRTEGYEVATAQDGVQALDVFSAQPIDLVLLDVMMPRLDGFGTCQRIREFSSVPIVILTARGEEQDRVRGLDLGADDYLAKPFHFDELVARIKALSRRYSSETTTPSALRANGLFIDRVKMSAYREGKDLGLTKKEFRLLEYFIRNEGKVLSKAELAENVWDVDFDTGTNIVEVYVNYLRNKPDKGYDKKMIATKFGMG